MHGWLPPLVQHVVENEQTAAVPILDNIVARGKDLIYEVRDPGMKDPSWVGCFDRTLMFGWTYMADHDRKRRKHLQTDPIMDPIMPGGVFAIRRKLFEELGGFDTGMGLYAGDNIEISLKLWMCAGGIQIIPCSRVGHVDVDHRRNHYKVQSVITPNIVRVAEVWIDPAFASFFYARLGIYGNHSFPKIGDISQRLQIRDHLKCNSFKWFLDEVFTQFDSAHLNLSQDLAYGELRLKNKQLCLDGPNGQHETMYVCHGMSGNQFWRMLRNGLIFDDNIGCLAVSNEMKVGRKPCLEGSAQIWSFDRETNLLQHVASEKCLEAELQGQLRVLKCDPNNLMQQWTFSVVKP